MSAKRITRAGDAQRWEFVARFRRHAFGWKSQPAIQRIKQAVSEIRQVSRRDPVLAAEGAVLFLERVSPAIEHVDGSSGAIGNAVNRAIEELVPIIAGAPADAKTRETWLERLWEAHAEDQIPYIERLADHWGELCGSREVASTWGDRLVGITRMALSPRQESSRLFPRHDRMSQRPLPRRALRRHPARPERRDPVAVQALGGQGPWRNG